jgi:NAD(P)-dependent dehydrogenase (short-subunit alcohol dehydrogenase family)
VAGFTRSLALELADRRIRVNAVAPGMARTGDNVASAGDDAAYVEMDDLTRGVMALAAAGPDAPTGEIRPIAPRGS